MKFTIKKKKKNPKPDSPIDDITEKAALVYYWGTCQLALLPTQTANWPQLSTPDAQIPFDLEIPLVEIDPARTLSSASTKLLATHYPSEQKLGAGRGCNCEETNEALWMR